MGALQQAVVITGLHHTFKALEIELLANTGVNPFNTLVCGAIVAQGAAGIAAALKTKDRKQQSLYFTSVVPAFLGITEPLIFGGNLPRLIPFVCGCIGGGCAGVFSSLMGLAGTGMSITALPGILLYLNGQLGKYLIACGIGFAVAFLLTWVLPIVIFVAVGQLLYRRMVKNAGGPNAMSFGMGKSNAKIYVKSSGGHPFFRCGRGG